VREEAEGKVRHAPFLDGSPMEEGQDRLQTQTQACLAFQILSTEPRDGDNAPEASQLLLYTVMEVVATTVKPLGGQRCATVGCALGTSRAGGI